MEMAGSHTAVLSRRGFRQFLSTVRDKAVEGRGGIVVRWGVRGGHYPRERNCWC